MLGTGLTAMDVAIAVTDAHPRAWSTRRPGTGWSPRVHRGNPQPGGPTWLPALAGPSGPVRLGELMWQVRAAMADRPEACEGSWTRSGRTCPGCGSGCHWPTGRSSSGTSPYWEVHRHRMPPDTARRISELHCAGRLSVHAGQISAVTAVPGGIRARVEGEAGTSAEHEAGWLVNATGPAADITRTSDPLLRGLFGRGLARPDPLRLGLDASPGGALLDTAGRPAAPCSRSGRRCAGCDTRPRPSRRSGPRPPLWPCA